MIPVHYILFFFFFCFNFFLFGDDFELIAHDNTIYALDGTQFHSQKITSHPYEQISLTTADGTIFPAYIHKNKSDTLVIIGHGFQNNHLQIMPIAELLHDHYDVMLFDYRWAGQLGQYLKKSSTLSHPTTALLLNEKEEIESVVAYARGLGTYKKIIGLGQCYSGFVFVLAQADATQAGRKLFDKLILDSCFYSVNDLLKSFLNDPYLAVNSKKGGFPDLLRKALISNHAIGFVDFCFKMTGKHFPLTQSLKKINQTPVLFIHGKQDKLVPPGSFKKLWKAAPADKCHISTPFYHVEQIKHPGLYAYACRSFIDCPLSTHHSTYLASTAFKPYTKESTGVTRRKHGGFFKRLTHAFGNS